MINPNICKYVLVNVLPLDIKKTTIQKAIYKNTEIEIFDFQVKPIGKRRMYLKYSIINDQYYLKSR